MSFPLRTYFSIAIALGIAARRRMLVAGGVAGRVGAGDDFNAEGLTGLLRAASDAPRTAKV